MKQGSQRKGLRLMGGGYLESKAPLTFNKSQGGIAMLKSIRLSVSDDALKEIKKQLLVMNISGQTLSTPRVALDRIIKGLEEETDVILTFHKKRSTK